ncbi:phosphoribosylglycinamide formyltransferase [Phormidesmis priestleyi ULC007]|uniref:Phosphoribosylglycinamide formyltransferase n=1 Tax=Phormidesmis priestleyi ULC007 TaxID=1920490 RepID=A0A2T1DBY5_9CYAN|nr:phosphoribosylglycinamide formyltransferase [Phormidesmis priestleyi]PSB18042.1 phosphoribosylglycinamide formyltransferase [Phormidesmis priestleyi ULC007]PZO49382.1 MAG: phosphoribosylglycinamide formyltransferase [Phormidesmis priestleyi]
MSNSPAIAEVSSLISPSPTPIADPQPPVKLGVMASGSGSNFEAIAQAIADRQLNAQVELLIYNNPGAKVVERTARWGVPSALFNHREFENREDLDRAIVQALQQAGVEWVIMAGWMRIVTPILICAFENRILNIHPSLLPSFKGNRAVEQALEAGVKITGCTVHLVVPEVDSGTIIMQAAVPVLPDDTVETLQNRIHLQEHQIYPPAIGFASQAFRKKLDSELPNLHRK